MADLRIATRRSQLALTQAGLVAGGLRHAHPGIAVDLVEVTTSGDRDRTSPVAALTEVGAFVRAVQLAVLDGRADLAVHSAKDLPVAGLDGLEAVYPEREAPWDVICGGTIDSLRPGAVVGTGSPRRAAQLRLLRPDLEICEIRGNVDTRLRRVDAGEFDATLLALAGLRRLGLTARIDQTFGPGEMVPAAGQGTLAVEAQSGSEALRLLAALDHPPTRVATETERSVLEISHAGCRAALGVYARAADSGVAVDGFISDERGARRASVAGPTARVAAVSLCEALEIRP